MLTLGAVLAVSALMSYAYAKDEIISTAGVFYAVAAYVAIRGLIETHRVGVAFSPVGAAFSPVGAAFRRPTATWAAVLLVVISLTVTSAWAIRSAGLHFRLRHGAFEARAEWAYILSPTAPQTWPKDSHTRQVVSRMRDEALLHPTVAPAMLPKWTEQWWGED